MRRARGFWLGIGLLLAGAAPCCQTVRPAATPAGEPEAFEPAGPPSAAPADGLAAAAGPERWPLVREGSYVRLMGRVWNTRKPALVREAGGVGTLGQRNGTATYLGEAMVDGGRVEFDVRFDAGYLAVGGGGKHFMEIMSWVADRSDRQAVAAQPWSRIEVDNLGDRPRCIVWNYGSHFRGQATTIFSVGPPFQPDRWYHVAFDWSFRAPAGRVTIQVDDRSYAGSFEFVPGTVGPGRFYLFGHVETVQPDGCMHFRNFTAQRPP